MANTFTPVARTPLHHWHARQGAAFVDRDGWQVARAESKLADISALTKMSVQGPGVAELVRSLSPGGSEVKPRGVCRSGSELLACRLTDDHLLLLQTGGTAAEWKNCLDNLAQGPGCAPQCLWHDATSAYAGFALNGPDFGRVLSGLTQIDLRETAFPVNTCAETGLAGVEALLVLTAAETQPCLRIYVAWDLAEYVWERVVESLEKVTR